MFRRRNKSANPNQTQITVHLTKMPKPSSMTDEQTDDFIKDLAATLRKSLSEGKLDRPKLSEDDFDQFDGFGS